MRSVTLALIFLCSQSLFLCLESTISSTISSSLLEIDWRREEALDWPQDRGKRASDACFTDTQTTDLIWRLQSAQMGILAVVEGFITPRPRRGADLCPLVGVPFAGTPPRSGMGDGLGIPGAGAGAGAGAKTGAGPVGAGGLGAGVDANAGAGAGPGACLGAGAGVELTIGTEAGGGMGAEASLEGAPGAGPLGV